jgi:hypothetical protein
MAREANEWIYALGQLSKILLDGLENLVRHARSIWPSESSFICRPILDPERPTATIS